jgi:hypothetical protein
MFNSIRLYVSFKVVGSTSSVAFTIIGVVRFGFNNS